MNISKPLLVLLGVGLAGYGFYTSYLRLKQQVAPAKVEKVSAEEPECQVSPQSLNPLINVKSKNVSKVIEDGYSQELKLYIQHVVLKDNTHLEYSEGGCVHFSFELSYSPYKPSKNSSHVFASDALKELKKPIYTSPEKTNVFMMGLKKILIEKDVAVEDELRIECGDATCSAAVVDNKLILTYDMPL